MTMARIRARRGNVEILTVVAIVITGMLAALLSAIAFSTSSRARDIQRDALAQEALDVAIAQAIFTLNEDYGVVSDTGTYLSDEGAYDRSLPQEGSPESSDMTQFNATKETAFSQVDGQGRHGVQAQARWWVDAFDVEYGYHDAIDQDRVRAAAQVGDLHVEARIVSASGDTVYAYRAVQIPLYQAQARAAQASVDGRGLSYVASPLTLFQFAAFGERGVQDGLDDGHVVIASPIAASGDIVMIDPDASTLFEDDPDAARRYDANVALFGSGTCLQYDPSDSSYTDCQETRSVNMGFELTADTALLEQVSQYCGSEGLDDFVASQQEQPSLVAADTTYCFRNFIMDEDVRLLREDPDARTVRIFVADQVHITDGARFTDAAGASISGAPDTAPQAAIFTTSTDVLIEASASDGEVSSVLFVYAPEATCEPGRMRDDPSTGGIDESAIRGQVTYVGSLVCDTVVLDYAAGVMNVSPDPGVIEFGAAGFGSDVYPANLWYLNRESTEFVARTEW